MAEEGEPVPQPDEQPAAEEQPSTPNKEQPKDADTSNTGIRSLGPQDSREAPGPPDLLPPRTPMSPPLPAMFQDGFPAVTPGLIKNMNLFCRPWGHGCSPSASIPDILQDVGSTSVECWLFVSLCLFSTGVDTNYTISLRYNTRFVRQSCGEVKVTGRLIAKG
eukprot:704941-Pyramimonas_sp.AAC.1